MLNAHGIYVLRNWIAAKSFWTNTDPLNSLILLFFFIFLLSTESVEYLQCVFCLVRNKVPTHQKINRCFFFFLGSRNSVYFICNAPRFETGNRKAVCEIDNHKNFVLLSFGGLTFNWPIRPKRQTWTVTYRWKAYYTDSVGVLSHTHSHTHIYCRYKSLSQWDSANIQRCMCMCQPLVAVAFASVMPQRSTHI